MGGMMDMEIVDLTGRDLKRRYPELEREAAGDEGRVILCPALADIQVNGFDGVDFNSVDLCTEKLEKASRSLAGQGIGTYFPTVVTNSTEEIRRRLQIICRAAEESALCRKMIGGIHLEGPFISKEDGPRGAHPKKYVTRPRTELIKQWQEAAGGLIKMITFSPEWNGMEEFLKVCAQENILAAIGHTAANTGKIEEAVRMGACCSTHLGNGAHAYLKRHPNYIWDQLSQEKLYASVIADGHHLPANVLKVFAKVKREKLILISDATQFSGKPPGTYSTLIGGKVVLTEEKRLYVAEHPDYLAGSAMGLLDMLNHIKRSKVFPIEYALECASYHPRDLMKRVCKSWNYDIIIFCENENEIRYLGRYEEVFHRCLPGGT